MPRLFVAVGLPEFVKERLSALCAPGLSGVSWVKENQFHLSLCFIGEVDRFGMEAAFGALEKIKSPCFSLTLKGAGSFPHGKPPRVLWAGVEKNELLNRLQKKVTTGLNQAGVKVDKRRFHPHVTLGRVKGWNKRMKGLEDFVSSRCLFETEEFPVEEYSLFSSLLTPKGAIYSKEAIYKLD